MASGYGAPPSRSVTKLYNFSAITAWDGDTVERLHGGTIRFADGWHDEMKRNLQDELDWESSALRCLHLCFLRRSSRDAAAVDARENIMETHRGGLANGLRRVAARLTGRKTLSTWKRDYYRRGPAGGNLDKAIWIVIFGTNNRVGVVAINLEPRKGSWGGANQWTSQLTKYLRYCGYEVRHDLRRPVDAIVMTHTGLSAGTSFGADEVEAYKKKRAVPCIHRINDNDIRKGTNEMDAFLSKSSRVADHTVFVSEWLRDHHAAKWFDRARPHSVIEPGADPAVFHPLGNKAWSGGEAFRIVTHHWSDNWSKGFDVYRDIDDAIASGTVQNCELCIVGRWPKDLIWKTARTFGPASGRCSRICCGNATRMSPPRATSRERCTRSRDCNAGCRCFITPRPAGR